MKKSIIVLLVCVLLFTFIGCNTNTGAQEQTPAESGDVADASNAGESDASETIRVGVVLPMTGGSARMGELQLEGIKLFLDYYNEQHGGIESMGGAKIELVLADSTGNPEVGVSELERLVNNEDIVAVLGPYNSAVGAAMVPIAEKYGLPFVVTNCTADNVLEGDLKYCFRANNCNSDNAARHVQFIKELEEMSDEPISRVAIVYENTDWGYSSNEEYLKALETAGYDIVISESFETGAPDMSSIVNKIKNADVDIIVPMMYLSDSQLFTQQLKEYDVNTLLVSGGGGFLADDFIKTLGPYSEYICSITGWGFDTLLEKPELALEINEKCIADVGGPVMETVAHGWLGAGVLVNALERSESTDGDVIAQALAETKIGKDGIELLLHSYEGVEFGNVRTMTNQNIYAFSVMTQILDGQYRIVSPLIGETNPLVWPIPTWDERIDE